MYELILAIIALMVLVVASYTDLKVREVPDWANYSLIFAALGIRAMFSIQLGWNIIISGILGFTVFFLLAFIFYHTNQWGGGDSKLLMGMGAVIGISFPFDKSSLTILWFFLILMFIGSIYGLIWMFYIAIRKRSLFVPNVKKRFIKHKILHVSFAIITFNVLIMGLVVNIAWLIVLFPIFIYYLLMFVSIVEDSCFIVKVSTERLTEGDWLAEDVFIKDKVVLRRKTLEKDDIEKLSQLEKSGNITHVAVKEGIPFVPSFFFAYVIVLFGGNFIAALMGSFQNIFI
ncbi:MAG: A24 family peptidase [Nanoarchaeota archaeon]|nr:A24 family peptidase [Nanoarchaeota archaeon]MBU1632580.1 A24 family peptidase [Nanoarchaeota archaeon]MBU1875790.1 A24 family peptidase [Nanoarchaeota archaeon]